MGKKKKSLALDVEREEKQSSLEGVGKLSEAWSSKVKKKSCKRTYSIAGDQSESKRGGE